MNARKYVRDETDVRVDLVSSTPRPDELVVRCARGDTSEQYVGSADLVDILADTQYQESDYDRVVNNHLPSFTQTKAHNTAVPRGIAEQRTKVYAVLRRLFRRNHWGPFEHPHVTVGFKNISVQSERQLTRHRHATFDVQSLRYVDVSDTVAGESVDSPTTSQAQPGVVGGLMPKSAVDADHATRHGQLDMDDADRERAQEIIADEQQDAGDSYRELRALGMPAEDARVILGMGTQINMTMTANLRTVLHVLNLRESAGDAQWEIRGITGLLEEELRSWAPMTMDLWDQHGPIPDGP